VLVYDGLMLEVTCTGTVHSRPLSDVEMAVTNGHQRHNWCHCSTVFLRLIWKRRTVTPRMFNLSVSTQDVVLLVCSIGVLFQGP